MHRKTKAKQEVELMQITRTTSAQRPLQVTTNQRNQAGARSEKGKKVQRETKNTKRLSQYYQSRTSQTRITVVPSASSNTLQCTQ